MCLLPVRELQPPATLTVPVAHACRLIPPPPPTPCFAAACCCCCFFTSPPKCRVPRSWCRHVSRQAPVARSNLKGSVGFFHKRSPLTGRRPRNFPCGNDVTPTGAHVQSNPADRDASENERLFYLRHRGLPSKTAV